MFPYGYFIWKNSILQSGKKLKHHIRKIDKYPTNTYNRIYLESNQPCWIIMLCLGWMSVYASFIKLLKSDAPTRPNHMTDLRRGSGLRFNLFKKCLLQTIYQFLFLTVQLFVFFYIFYDVIAMLLNYIQ